MYIPHIKLNEKGNLKVKGFCQISVNGGHKKFGIEVAFHYFYMHYYCKEKGKHINNNNNNL